MSTSGARKRGRSSHLKIIIYCFSFQSFVNLQKESWQAAQFRLRMQEVWEPGPRWPPDVRLQTCTDIRNKLPQVCYCLQRCCSSSHSFSHDTPGSLVKSWNDAEVVLVWGLWGFFPFFALLLENEIFSSFLKNKLVNKLILFCFYFTQSFIFNPIPEKQNC